MTGSIRGPSPTDILRDVDGIEHEIARDVKATPQGWFIVKDRIMIPYENARRSPDGMFHICRREDGKGEIITPASQPPCFWAPEGAS